MLKIGTRVKIKDNLNEKETGIMEHFLNDIRGKESIIVKGYDFYTLEIDPRFGFYEEWLEVLEEDELC